MGAQQQNNNTNGQPPRGGGKGNKMTTAQIKRILDAHGVDYYERDGRVYADSMEAGARMFERVEDVTEWSAKKLRDWLGY